MSRPKCYAVKVKHPDGPWDITSYHDTEDEAQDAAGVLIDEGLDVVIHVAQSRFEAALLRRFAPAKEGDNV